MKRSLLVGSFLPTIRSKRAIETIVTLSGRPDEIHQLSQKLNKQSRIYCKKENGYVGKLSNPRYFKHLSMKALAWESDLTAMRLDGNKLQTCKSLTHF